MNKKKHRIACIILNYNDSETTMSLANCIKEYSAIDYIVIVDNASTDCSLEKLSKLKSEKISIHLAENNSGYGAGNNLGIRVAKEKYGCDIALIANPDVSFEEKCIEEMVKCFDRHLEAAVVAPVQMDGDGKIVYETAWDIPSAAECILFSLSLIGKIHRKKKKIPLQKDWNVECVAGAFLAVRIEYFLMAGGYDESIFLYCEETTLGYRLKQAGFSSFVVTDIYYLHKHSVSINKSIPSVLKQRKMLLNSRLYVIRKYLSHSKGIYYFAKIAFFIAKLEGYMIGLAKQKNVV